MITYHMLNEFREGYGKVILPKSGVSNYFKMSGWTIIEVLMYYIEASRVKLNVTLEPEVFDAIKNGIERITRNSNYPDEIVYYSDLLDQFEEYFEGKDITINPTSIFNFTEDNEKRLKKMLRMIFNGKNKGYTLFKHGNYYYLGLNKSLYAKYKGVRIFDLNISEIL